PRLIRETRIASFTKTSTRAAACAARPRSAGSLRLLLDDPDLDRRLDVGVQVHDHVEHADLLERVLEADLTLFDRDALLAQRGGDLGDTDRTEQVALGVGAAFDR